MSSFLSRCRQRLESPLTPIFITVFVDLFAVALVMPLMPQIRTNLGIEAHTWGLLSSWYGACQFISSLFMGRISDAYGRRLVFAISCIGAATSYQIMTHATSLWMLFVARLIVGLCKQTTSTAHALIGDWSHVSQRATMLGNVNMMIGLAMIVGSPAGGHLAHTDFYLPVKVATALFIVEMIIIVYWLPGTPPPSHVVPTPVQTPIPTPPRRSSQPDQVNVRAVHVQSTSEQHTNGTPDTHTPRKHPSASSSHPTRNGLFHTLLFYIRDPLLSKILIILILFYISTKSYRDSLLITLQTRFSLQPVDLGWISSYLGILSAAIQGFALKPMTARWDERTLTFICLGGQCIGHAICSIAPTLTIWMIFYPIIAITSGVLRTSLVGIVTKAVPRQELGTVLGMISSLGSLTYIIGPTIGGLAIRYYGVTAPHLMSFGMALIIGMYAHTYFPDLHGVNNTHGHGHGHGHETSQEMTSLIPKQKEMNGNVREIDPRIKVLAPQHKSDTSLSPLSAPTITSAGLKSPRPAHPRVLHPNPTSHSQESPPLSPSPIPYSMIAMSP